MKKILTFLLAVVMVVTAIPFGTLHVSAEDDGNEKLTFTVVGGTAIVGKTATVDIVVSNNTGFAGATLEVGYNSSVMTLKGYEPSSWEPTSNFDENPTKNPVAFSWVRTKNYTANTTFLSLTFEIKNNAREGDYSITLASEFGVFDQNQKAVDFALVGGKISVKTYIPGDTTGDSIVNAADAVLLAQYLAKWDIDINLDPCDCNGDGTVNAADAVLLAQYLAKWDVTLVGPERPGCSHASLTAVEAKPATCTEDGNLEYWRCPDCEKYFSDSNAETEITIADTVDKAKGHTEVIDEAVAATCKQTGLTEGSHCSVCNTVLVAQTETEKLNHTPGAQSTCTEDQTCTVCGEVLESANGHIPGVEATCTTPQVCTVCLTVLADPTGHSLTYFPEQDPVDGNNPGNCAYWKCSKCNKCYRDEEASQEIAIEDTPWKLFKITYYCDEAKTKDIVWYKVGPEVDELLELEVEGYDFNYWKDGTGKRVNSVTAGNTQNLELYADVTIITYTIYLGGTWPSDSKITYTIKDQIDLTDPIEDGLTFAGWRDGEGKLEEYTDSVGVRRWRIPRGTTGDISLMAQWKDNRDLVVPDTRDAKDRYVGSGYDETAGRYWFLYSLGEIRNVVLDEESQLEKTDHDGGKISGKLYLSTTETVEKSVGESISQTVSHTVTKSTNWSDTKGWEASLTVGQNVSVTIGSEVDLTFAKAKAEMAVGLSLEGSETASSSNTSGGSNGSSDGTEDTIESNFTYKTSLSQERAREQELNHDVAPGVYYFANVGTVDVYAFVVYDPVKNTLGLETFSILRDGTSTATLSDKKDNREYVSDALSFDIDIPGINKEVSDNYFVQYFANNGETNASGKPLNIVKMYPRDTEIELAEDIFSKNGYTLDGWIAADKNEYDTGKAVTNFAGPGQIIALEAHWVQNVYTVQYNANPPGASSRIENMPNPDKITCQYDVSFTLANAPSLTGWTFGGWYSDSKCTYKIGDPGEKTARLTSTSGGVVNLYAKWTANIYTVTYNANGGTIGTGTENKIYDSNYGTLPTPTRLNCTFAGWYLGDEKIESTTKVTTAGDHILVARWVPMTSGYWTTGDRDVNVSTSGRTEYWQTGLNRDALKAAGYTQFTIKIKMAGIFDSGDWFKADWWFEIYDPSGNMIVEENEGHWDTEWETREYSYTINLDTIRDDGTILVWYDHSGDGADDFRLGKLEIWTTAK